MRVDIYWGRGTGEGHWGTVKKTRNVDTACRGRTGALLDRVPHYSDASAAYGLV